MSKKNTNKNTDKKKLEMIINKVNIYELDYNQLIQFANTLNNKLTKERESRILLQVDKEQLNVFLNTTNENLMKLVIDVSNMHRVAGENTSHIADLEKRLRQQSVMYTNENMINLNRMHLENEKVIRTLAEEYRKQTNELFRLTSSLQQMAENKNIEHRNHIKDIQLENIKTVDDQANNLKKQMIQVLDRTDKKRLEMYHEVESLHYIEIQNHQSINDKNVKLMNERYTKEILSLKTYYDERCQKELALVHYLKDKLQKVIEKNMNANTRELNLRQENKKLSDRNQELEKKNQNLEKNIKNYDFCIKASSSAAKKLKNYKTLFELKSCENEILENDNAEMKQAFKRYDDYFISVIVDLQSRFTDVKFLTGANFIGGCDAKTNKNVPSEQGSNDLQRDSSKSMILTNQF